MKHEMEIENLQDLIVDKMLVKFSERKYMSADDKEWELNEALNNIADLLLRMVQE